jgi:hypothetical protein
MRRVVLIFLLFTCLVHAQQDTIPNFEALDAKYREDQFYLSVTYNVWQNRPDGVRQNKFSPGMSVGFLRDMPVNKNRTWAIAAGIGYAFNNFSHNIFMDPNENAVDYNLLASDLNFNKNKVTLHYLECPLEIRWRTSTPESHKFWRIYTGFKVSYLFADQYKFDTGSDSFVIRSNKDLNKWQYGGYICTGYNTWNFYLYYAFNPIFKSAQLTDGPNLSMQTLQLGLLFYIL